MSHSTCLVIVEKDSPDPQKRAEELLASFDENIVAPEYDCPCYCIDRIAIREGERVADEKCGTIDALRKTFWANRAKGGTEEQENAAWKAHISEYRKVESEVVASHPMKGKPDPECSQCNGTGTYRTTYNPKSKWDWYELGGRWQRHLQEKNIANVAELFDGDGKPRVTTFAVLTPDGEWHERGHMGWFGYVSNEKEPDNWSDEYVKILNKHRDCIALCYDVHI